MKKRVIASVVACAAVGLAFFGFAACDKAPTGDGSGDNTLAKIDVGSITVSEEIFPNGKLGTVFSWSVVENATAYLFDCNGTEVKSTYPSVTVQNYNQITLPSDGVFNVSISATAYGYTPSEPVSYTYTVRGCELNGISVTSFDDGILKWKADPLAKGYLVSVNGGASVAVTANEFDLNGSEYAGAAKVTVRATGDGLYTKTGTAFTVKINAEHTKVHLLPIEEYTVADGVVRWSAVPGVTKYKVVDIERNTVVTEDLFYDYSESLPVYGVYPISDNAALESAAVEPVLIPYLEGEGTNASPYKIKTPVDFRAIDYYEARYAEKLKTDSDAPRVSYVINNNIDFNAVGALEEESNFYALSQPFYGTLNGNGKELSNIRVRHRSGYWAMFDYITNKGAVMNIKFVSPDIQNSMIQPTLPLNASIATIAYKNYGIISAITVKDANYKTAGGEIGGICWDNRGIVQNCVFGGIIEQKATGQPNQACFEMAGIVSENNGTVSGNKVTTLEIRGTAIPDNGSSYNNVRCAAGIVSVNRAGGTVSNNSFETVTMSTVLNAITEHEFGGIVAYNAGTVVKGSGSLGTFIHNGTTVSAEVGTSSSLLGKLIGKNEGKRS
ncbi:MAG: hypothetical protein J1F39_02675 [Clostridiales bacterium]|nr:hypothetical protein [Clostridiales bacterium]